VRELRGGKEEMTKEEAILGLKAGKKLRCDRRDDPLLPWLLEDPAICNSGVQQVDDQYSYIEFWWRG
jgi:hypothetical protein